MTIASFLLSVNETKAKLRKVDDNEQCEYFRNKCRVRNFVLEFFKARESLSERKRIQNIAIRN